MSKPTDPNASNEPHEPADPQIAEAFGVAARITLAPGPREAREAPAAAPEPDDEWTLPNGRAWVYLADPAQGLTRPVILGDGFNSGPSELDFSWEILERGPYPFVSELRRRGYDVVLLGFDERSASILENAQVARSAIFEAIARRRGDRPLTVGGFSMGGLVTRYALAKMEHDGENHQTALYFSYDSPHRGAWIPIALQSFAHYIRRLNAAFSNQMNSPAARQLLCRHIAEWDDTPETDKERVEFLAELDRVGGWPRQPHTIGVANGVRTGEGNGIRGGEKAFRGKGLAITGTRLHTQSAGENQLVAQLRVVTLRKPQIRTSGLPETDGAPGGTLEGFGILADELNKIPAIIGFGSEADIREHCFVPVVSAIALRDIDTHEKLYSPVTASAEEESELDEFLCASRNEPHTLVTEELCTWILDRLP
ncbi:esterase/lipase family protein [Streptomyces sp. NPDC058284]|uniref:esterase/lipase family protein n=1 Tax=unclassified Streptomyces TaxID=2593676 RepID=UPI003648F602